MATACAQLDKPTFILSSGRTGTTALAKILDERCESTTALHEPKPSRNLRRASFAYLAGQRTRVQMVDELCRSRIRLCEELTEPHYVESNPYLVGFIEFLHHVFEQPRVVHVTRDPRTFVVSALNFGGQSGIKWLFSRLVPNWIIKPEQIDANCERTWAQMCPIERFAWFWRIVNEHLDRGDAIHGERYRRVRYEDLFSFETELANLAEWMGLTVRPEGLSLGGGERVNRSRKKVVPSWEEWRAEDQQLLLHHCGAQMERYGYDPESPTTSAGTSR